ncbi:unnamed protein product [Closterium sp. Yama58-4]|nr:unnamed protein product [Closterium sp. Yama58-4]
MDGHGGTVTSTSSQWSGSDGSDLPPRDVRCSRGPRRRGWRRLTAILIGTQHEEEDERGVEGSLGRERGEEHEGRGNEEGGSDAQNRGGGGLPLDERDYSGADSAALNDSHSRESQGFWHSAHSHLHGASPLDQVVVDTSAAPSVSFSDALMKEVLPRSFPDGSEGEGELWRKGDGLRKGFRRVGRRLIRAVKKRPVLMRRLAAVILIYILLAACMFLSWALMRSYATSALAHVGRSTRAQLVQGASAGMGAALASLPSSTAPTLEGTFISFSGTFPGEDSSGHLHTHMLLARITNNTLLYTVTPSQPTDPSLSDTAKSASPVASAAAQYLASAVPPFQLLSACFFSPDHVPLGNPSNPNNLGNSAALGSLGFSGAANTTAETTAQTTTGGTEQQYYVDACPVSVNASASSLQGLVQQQQQQQQQQGDGMVVISIVPLALILAPLDSGSDTVRALCIALPLVVLVVGLLLVCVNRSTDLAQSGQTLRQELVRQLVEKHRVEQRSNHKSQFLANMSHELRTPLASIIGLLDLLVCESTLVLHELRTPPASIFGLLDLPKCDSTPVLNFKISGGHGAADQALFFSPPLLPQHSHELRTPLAGIIGLLDLLACDALSPEQEAMVLQIKRCASGLLALINNVLDISKVEVGALELTIAPFSIVTEMETLLDMFAVHCIGSGVDLSMDLADDLPDMVLGDAMRFRQVLSNLLSNSVKFTEQGYIHVRAWVVHTPNTIAMVREVVRGLCVGGVADTAAESDAEGSELVDIVIEVGVGEGVGRDARVDHGGQTGGMVGRGMESGSAGAGVAEDSASAGAGEDTPGEGLSGEGTSEEVPPGEGLPVGERPSGEPAPDDRVLIIFEVDDTGCGIPPEKREVVFESFSQVDESASRVHAGSGLGLNIVKGLVELMGGHVAVADKDGPGALIRFSLMLSRVPSPVGADGPGDRDGGARMDDPDLLASFIPRCARPLSSWVTHTQVHSCAKSLHGPK